MLGWILDWIYELSATVKLKRSIIFLIRKRLNELMLYTLKTTITTTAWLCLSIFLVRSNEYLIGRSVDVRGGSNGCWQLLWWARFQRKCCCSSDTLQSINTMGSNFISNGLYMCLFSSECEKDFDSKRFIFLARFKFSFRSNNQFSHCGSTIEITWNSIFKCNSSNNQKFITSFIHIICLKFKMW